MTFYKCQIEGCDAIVTTPGRLISHLEQVHDLNFIEAGKKVCYEWELAEPKNVVFEKKFRTIVKAMESEGVKL